MSCRFALVNNVYTFYVPLFKLTVLLLVSAIDNSVIEFNEELSMVPEMAAPATGLPNIASMAVRLQNEFT
jgi:hypothetical protein